jgi:hypothetical protein
MSWQKMETAPKDRRILVFVPNTYDNVTISGIFTAQWVNGLKWQGWESGHAGYQDESATINDPTHWRELPEGPADMVVAA